MTRDDIIKLAREAGVLSGYESDLFQRFAALIISHHDKANRPKPDASEREWLQQIAYQHGGIGDLSGTEFEFGAMVAAAERTECAKVCDVYAANDPKNFADICAAAIRARSNT